MLRCQSRSFVLALALSLFAAMPSVAADPQPIKVVAFGDSTTATRSNVEHVYADRLPDLLSKKGFQAEVINAGIGSSHTGRLSDTPQINRRHALDRFQTDVRNPQPDVVIIQFGWNDSWADGDNPAGSSRISLAAFSNHLAYFVRTLRADGAFPILMTLNPPHTEMDAWRVARTAEYAQATRDVAAELGVPLIDIWQQLTAAAKGNPIEDWLVVGVHPNDRAPELVATLSAEEIAATYKPAPDETSPPRGYSIPLIDLAGQIERQVIVDREPGQYLGHPTTVLLEDGRTMLCVYPKGHGKGAVVYKRSTDGGLTWSERLPTPKSWETSKEVPTLHRVIGPDGTKRIIMFSGLYPVRMAVTEDDGKNWSELEPVGDWGGIVAMGSVIDLHTGPGHYMALFHDDGRFIRADGTNDKKFIVYKSLSTDGGLTWSQPVAIAHRPDVHLCEPGAIRSPDGKQIAVLLRENSRTKNSFVIFTDDEGVTWTEPRELPGALTGDRHTGRYTLDGRLFISFRDQTHVSPTRGDWVGWLGTYDDIVHGGEGQYRVRLMDNHKGADCAYPPVEILPDGTVVTTTYGHWTEGEAPYVASVRFQPAELDLLARQQIDDDALFVATPATRINEFTPGIEGPACDADGNVYAVNIYRQGTIGKVTPQGDCSIFVSLPGDSVGNGIRFTRDGRMFIADYVNHNIFTCAADGSDLKVHAHHDGMNQPNDLAITSTGVLYASDPGWAKGDGQLWRIDTDGTVTLVAPNLGTTNGIEVSPDDNTLFVNESNARLVYKFAIDEQGNLSDKTIIHEFPDFGMDGMRCDVDGNLYVTRHGKGTVVKLSPDGEMLNEVDVLGTRPSNICFGGPDGCTAYVTEVDYGRLVQFRTDRPGLAWHRWHAGQ